jgi:ligand-binding sensor domain-containing protein
MTYHTKYLFRSLLGSLFCLATSLYAADLKLTPDNPIVETGKELTLAVTGTDRTISAWKAIKGQISSSVGYQATYKAPAEAGLDVVTVADTESNKGTVKIKVIRAGTFAPENANWKVFANRRTVAGLLLSDDKETLWVATTGGLEQREASTTRLIRVYTTQHGLPHNFVQPLLSDKNKGLWIGTQGGLVHLRADGKIEGKEIFKSDSAWAQKFINSLSADDSDGLWVTARDFGLVHRHADGTEETFTPSNSGLPDTWTYSPVLDGKGGVWVGTRKGLAHRLADGQWQVFDTSNSKLPDNRVVRLLPDGQGGLWIGTGDNNPDLPPDSGGGVAHLDATENWEIFNTSNSPFPGNIVWSLTSDKQNGFWVGVTDNGVTDRKGGLVHRRADGTWQVFTPTTSQLPQLAVSALYADNQEGVWVGTGNGFAYLHEDETWDLFTPLKDEAPSNIVLALDGDGNGGLWVAGGDVAELGEGGLAHLSAEGVWQTKINSLTFAVSADSKGGVWMSMVGFLVHFPASGKPDQVFSVIDNPNYSKLPGKIAVVLSIVPDNTDGIWIAGNDISLQQGGGLAHLLADRTWEVFDTSNSKLPADQTTTLAADGQGGLWIGTLKGLAHLHADKTWEVFTPSNSQLPEESVMSLATDGQGGVWIGTMMSGIAHLQADKTWQIFNQGNTPTLPSNGIIKALLADGRDGVWAGIVALDLSQLMGNSSFPTDASSLFGDNGGLVHLTADGIAETFNSNNSGLPDNNIVSLKSDGKGGIWVGTTFGLAYLTFSKKPFLCAQLEETACDALLKGRRAAIIIAGGGNDQKNKTLWDTTEAITNSIYNMLFERGFENDEIYYLSPKPWVDFTSDGAQDRVVDAPQPERPLQVEDVEAALGWAKQRGKLDQPLYLFFVDHGSNEKFLLGRDATNGSEIMMDASQFKGFLDNYTATNNQTVAVIDACSSGNLSEKLSPSSNRAIISSNKGSGKAYFYEIAKQGFSRFLADALLAGKNFADAFQDARKEQTKILPKITASKGEDIRQEPQWNDGSSDGKWLRSLFVNGNFPRDNPVGIKNLVTPATLPATDKHLFKAQINVTPGTQIKYVWAVLNPPRMNLVLDNNGTPILDLPRLNLSPTVDENIWQTTWRNAVYNGVYELTFYAEDLQGNSASSEPVTLTVTGGAELPSQAEVKLVLTPQQATYQVGSHLTAQLIENLSWGYDLYVAVLFPDGQFLTLEDTNQFTPFNQAKKWLGPKTQNSPITLLDLNLSAETIGKYCLYGILSPARAPVLEEKTQASWVETHWCMEVVK